MKTIFLRVLESADKAVALLAAVRREGGLQGVRRFEVAPQVFASIPGQSFAYWLPTRFLDLYATLPSFDNRKAGRETKCGLGTLDDFRFLRLQWETDETATIWKPYFSGGTFSPFYEDFWLVVKWGRSGDEVKTFVEAKVGSASRKVQGEDHYFRSGFVFPRRTRAFSPKCMPSGGIFSTSGQAGFMNTNDLAAGVGILSSWTCSLLLTVSQGTTPQDAGGTNPQFEVGQVKRLPWPPISDGTATHFGILTRRAWSLKRSLDTRNGISRAFTLPALLQVAGADFAARAATWSEHVRDVESELVAIQAEIDERCFALYGIGESDRRAISEGFGGNAKQGESSSDADDVEDDAEEETDQTETTADATGLAAELVSWAVGVAFGRFDMRLATGARPLPTEPEPFDPLPVCSPGMLTGGDGLPLARPPAGYPLVFPEAGVLVDDLGHAQDLPTALRAVFDAVFGAGADRWWNDVAALLDPKSHDLRVWLAGSFFEHHLKRHSKSRRKAPIVWQLGTPSGRYSVWLYAHRLTRDSLFQLQNEVVGPKLAHEERQLTSLIQNAGSNPPASERRAIAAQETFVEELREMLDEVKRSAPLWNPNLDDGVVLTMAPLWRLVPQHKAWQKELMSKWDELAAGKYDWAHLAMHLWPERVVPKCATDRSLAIAHGFEDAFWAEEENGKWKSRTTPLRPVEDLVSERSSPAVKAALKSLLDAPTASGNGRARGGRRAASAANTVGGGR